MKQLIAAIAAVMMVCSVAQANVVTFYGRVTETRPGSILQVGDDLVMTFIYVANGTHRSQVMRYTILDTTTGQTFTYGKDGTRVFIDNNPCEYSIFYQTEDSLNISITMQAITSGPPDCVVPPLPAWQLNDFVFQFNTFGVLTAPPQLHGGR